MDVKVLYNLTYGLYIVGAFDGDRPCGCVINTCFQVTSEDPKVVISLNKNNYTLDCIRKSGRFGLSILSEESDPLLITMFGFMSGRTADKYEDFGYEERDGVPLVAGSFAGRLICEAIDYVDCGTHVLVTARVKDTVEGVGTPMTYGYYRDVIKGKAPKNAPTYRPE